MSDSRMENYSCHLMSPPPLAGAASPPSFIGTPLSIKGAQMPDHMWPYPGLGNAGPVLNLGSLVSLNSLTYLSELCVACSRTIPGFTVALGRQE